MKRVPIIGLSIHMNPARICDYIEHDDGTEILEIKNIRFGEIPLADMLEQIDSARKSDVMITTEL